MKSCPGCLFLIDDDQELCDTCLTQQNTTIQPLKIGSAEGGTAVLERTTSVAAPAEPADLRYRSTRPLISLKVAVVSVLLVVLGAAVASAGGYGPLAPKFVSWHLAFNRPEAFPQTWEHLDDLSEFFEVDLPGGSESVFEALDPADNSQGGLVGKSVTTVRGAQMQVTWSSFGKSSEALAAFDSADGVTTLLRKYAALRIPGVATVERPVMLPIGQAVDAVFVQGETTTRVRMIMTPKEVFMLSTGGPDGDSEALDAAHQRLLKSFQPNL